MILVNGKVLTYDDAVVPIENASITTTKYSERNLALTSPKPIRRRCAWNPVALEHRDRGNSLGMSSSADYVGDPLASNLSYVKAEKRGMADAEMTDGSPTNTLLDLSTDLTTMGRDALGSKHSADNPWPAAPMQTGRVALQKKWETMEHPDSDIIIKGFIMWDITFTVADHEDVADMARARRKARDKVDRYHDETDMEMESAPSMSKTGATEVRHVTRTYLRHAK